ncbi:hypothetical protein GCM10018793_49300 [Streptomyces sulfonofaciens]|uniref:Chalcone/stilbene synthase N-terminal domain-containing protein n=1 Tax=Streptomyces sulfonofaciens TaxID=68272 RepID=A0A919GGG2_9ACTN|nr:hypothetical protein [Streptomyces sulfonofaciens]GHH84562.1 hypothetical protein GCM10018793_49300 [Streptomyces sulfonofaciens]
MSLAYVHRPASVRGRYEVSMEETVETLKRAIGVPNGRNDPRLADRVEGLARNTLIKRRYWARPLSEVSATSTFEERNEPAVEAMVDMGERALQDALANADCLPSDIFGLVVSHSTTPRTPGPAQHWITRLGLPRDTWIIPMTELGCLGGVHSLALAAQLVAGQPGRKVAVCVSECLHTVYRGAAKKPGQIVHDLIYGDLAAACVVEGLARGETSRGRSGPGLVVKKCWTHTVPGTTGKYTLTTGGDGQLFDSDPSAPRMVPEVIRLMWRELLGEDDPGWSPDRVYAHPGSSKILPAISAGLGCNPEQIQTSWDSYLDGGNQGGGTVLDAIRRGLEGAPAHAEEVVVVGVGPGFSGTGIMAETVARTA